MIGYKPEPFQEAENGFILKDYGDAKEFVFTREDWRAYLSQLYQSISICNIYL